MSKKHKKNNSDDIELSYGDLTMFDTIHEGALELAKLKKHPILVFINPAPSKKMEVAIRFDHLIHLRTLLNQIETDQLGLLLHTFGGDCNASAQIAFLLQSKIENLTGYIPYYAYSGGTLIALACNELIMSEYANMGPLDVQDDIPFLKERRISNLAVSAGLEKLRDFSIETLKKIYPEIRNITGKRMQLPDELKAASEFANGFASSVVADLTVDWLGFRSRGLKMGDDYIERILKDNPYYFDEETQEPNLDKIRKLANRLVYSYNDHAFVISPSEAEAIGLPVYTASAKEQEIFDILAYEIARLKDDVLLLVDPVQKQIFEMNDGILTVEDLGNKSNS